MSAAYRIYDQYKVYFITLTITSWIEVLKDDNQKRMVIESLKYCQKNKGLIIYSYCIMSNHLHLICRAGSEKGLSSIMRDFKRFTAGKILRYVACIPEKKRNKILSEFSSAVGKNNSKQKYKVWQRDNRSIEISSNKFLDQKIEYIHQNPVKAGIVEKGIDYPFSSARNYAEMDGLLDVFVTYGKWKSY